MPQFWIDVGGTFTDCIAVLPDGTLRRHKLLSSGVTKGCVGQGSDATRIVDPGRRDDPTSFFDSYTLRLLDGNGHAIAESSVARFEPNAATLHLATPLSTVPVEGQPYELNCEEEAPITGIRYFDM